MASRPKSNGRQRRRIADKILANDLLTQAEWDWLARHSTYHVELHRYKPLVAEDAAKGREARRVKMQERKELEADAYRKAYSDIVQRMLQKAGQLQDRALDRALEELDALEPNEALIRLGISVSKDVADRGVGKAVQRIEGRVEHAHSVLDEMARSGELEIPAEDVEIIREAGEMLELESGE